MSYENIAEDIIYTCQQAMPFIEDLDPLLGEIYARASRDDDAGAIKNAAAGMMDADNPFARIQDSCEGIVNGWVGWSAEASDGLRMPEHFADMLEDGDYTYYAAHLLRELDDYPEMDPDGEARAYLDGIQDAKDSIIDALEPLLGKYGN